MLRVNLEVRVFRALLKVPLHIALWYDSENALSKLLIFFFFLIDKRVQTVVKTYSKLSHDFLLLSLIVIEAD